MHRYVKIKSDVASENLNVDTNNNDSDSSTDESADDINVENMEVDNINYNDDVDDVDDEDDVDDVDVRVNDHNDQAEDRDASVNADHVDIFDPKNWDNLTSNMIKILVAEGPKRDKSIEKGPKDTNLRRFASAFYTKILPNNERCDREWLVYSKELDKVFCFCCKIHRKGIAKGNLANEGFGDWKHLSTRLKEHEVSFEHINNMAKWFEMRQRLKTNKTIDKVEQKQFEKERDHWKNVIFRVICIVKFLAKHNITFRGSNESVEKSFLDFLNVDDTTGQGLFDVTQAELKALDLDIDDVRSQGYDNGSNMKGKHRGVAMTEVQDLISFFKEFRVTRFSNAVEVSKQIAIEMDINPLFIQKRVIRRKRQFNEDPVEQDVILSAEESFKVNYFFYIIDQAIVSLTTRFKQYKEYADIFGFLFTCDKLKLYDDDRLRSCCSRLEAALKNGFLNVDDTTGQGLFDVTQAELKALDLDIDDVRGQGYDNGSNMKGKHRGVQKKFLDINPRAFYTPCGCHSLNLTLYDMASTCTKVFSAIIQCIYTIFTNSSKRKQILKDNVKGLTLKSLSTTRWE
nr:zinc finger MYM-type protein 1-like [Tanacetum cinerariifolium]